MNKTTIFNFLSNPSLKDINEELHNKLIAYDPNYKIHFDNVVYKDDINISLLTALLYHKNCDIIYPSLDDLLNNFKTNLIVIYSNSNIVKYSFYDNKNNIILIKIDNIYHPVTIKKISYKELKKTITINNDIVIKDEYKDIIKNHTLKTFNKLKKDDILNMFDNYDNIKDLTKSDIFKLINI